LRNNDRLPAETFVYLVDWLNRAERLCFAEETKTTGTKAAVLFQWFRLYRLRFGLLPAVIGLLFQNPFATVTMLGNRTRIV